MCRGKAVSEHWCVGEKVEEEESKEEANVRNEADSRHEAVSEVLSVGGAESLGESVLDLIRLSEIGN